MVRAHESLTEQYIVDYIHLTHELYPPFLTKLSTIYYNLEVEASNFSDDFGSFYKDIDNNEHGGRYTAIYNLPVYMATNNMVNMEAGERGIETVASTEIKCNIDSMVNVQVNEGDLIAFNNGLHQYGIYRITAISMSSTLFRPHYQVSIRIVPNISVENMENFLVGKRFFLTNYHYIFEKGVTEVIIEIQKAIDAYITYFNAIYNHRIDCHVDGKNCAYLEFDRAFNELISRYNGHLFTAQVFRGSLCDNLLQYYDESNIFRYMLGLCDTNSGTSGLTLKNKRIDRSRRRSINNKVKVYSLTDKLDSTVSVDMPPSCDIWNDVRTNAFIENVKDCATRFIKECAVTDNMLDNATRLAQLLYLLNEVVKRNMHNSNNHFSSIEV